MSKQAISVTLEKENLLWLRGQAKGAGRRSVSEVIDRLVAAARRSGQVHESTIRSVVGTVQISMDDPDLRRADATLRALFDVPRRMKSRPVQSTTRKATGSGRRRAG